MLRSVDYSQLKSRFNVVRRRLREALPERQIYFRTEGRLNFYTLTTGAQTAVLGGMFVGIIASLAFWTVALFVEDPLTVRLGREILPAR